MCKTILSKITTLPLVVMIMMTLGVTNALLAVSHFWTGAVSTDPTDANNWNNGTPVPTVPKVGDHGFIGYNSAWEPVVPTNQPVLTSEWTNANGDPNAGWWIIWGSGGQNSLTIDDGAYIKFTHNDCNLRNGAILRVTGRSREGGPSLVIPPRFRIGQHGNDLDNYPDATSTILIEDDGYLRFDPSVAQKGSGGNQIYMGGEINALIEIRDDGTLEMVSGPHRGSGIVTPRFVFASSDPSTNKVVISGKGQLLLAGDPVTGLVGGEETSLEDMIAMGLITSGDEGVDLIVSGTNPTVVKLRGQGVSDPKPVDGKPDADRHVALSWDPGTLTEKYDVYFGTDFASVNDATRDNPLDVLECSDHMAASYPVYDVLSLEHGQTYYWRVDGVDVLPDQAVLKGKIWSFTVEPFVIPIPVQNITATASSQSVDQGPEKTIDRSGLDANDLHSNVLADMWLSDAAEPGSAWIEYEFDKAYKIRQMLVWNYNGEEILTRLGLKDVAIEYTTDGGDWIQLASVPVFQQAPGMSGYAAHTTVDFSDVAVKKVRITANNNWGDHPLFNQYGLSEVRFMHIPVAARQPSPASGATDVSIDCTLSWRAGREATLHEIHLGTDMQEVVDSTTPVDTVSQATYAPANLQLDTTYFWRVDEVNHVEDTESWPGDIWKFMTADCLVVDDFESYTDNSPNRVFQAWIDGLGFSADKYFPDGHSGNGTGAIVGYDPEVGPIMEYTIVHGGHRSMPLSYDGPSETTRTLEPAQDWARGGITALVLFFRGESTNVSGDLYVKINGVKVPSGGNASDLTMAEWQQWNGDLPAGLGAVKTLTIGISGGQGMLYIDDICLYRSAPAVNP